MSRPRSSSSRPGSYSSHGNSSGLGLAGGREGEGEAVAELVPARPRRSSCLRPCGRGTRSPRLPARRHRSCSPTSAERRSRSLASSGVLRALPTPSGVIYATLSLSHLHAHSLPMWTMAEVFTRWGKKRKNEPVCNITSDRSVIFKKSWKPVND